jgi:hypothetical protein
MPTNGEDSYALRPSDQGDDVSDDELLASVMRKLEYAVRTWTRNVVKFGRGPAEPATIDFDDAEESACNARQETP